MGSAEVTEATGKQNCGKRKKKNATNLKRESNWDGLYKKHLIKSMKSKDNVSQNVYIWIQFF